MSEVYVKAVAYLARREHCRFELRQKLLAKDFSIDEVEQVLDLLIEQDLLSEDRYVESMVRHRSGLGYGASRIRQQLQAMKLPDELISAYIQEYNWPELMRAAWQKKFGGELPQDAKMRRKQVNFLLYRGFSMDNVQRLLNGF